MLACISTETKYKSGAAILLLFKAQVKARLEYHVLDYGFNACITSKTKEDFKKTFKEVGFTKDPKSYYEVS